MLTVILFVRKHYIFFQEYPRRFPGNKLFALTHPVSVQKKKKALFTLFVFNSIAYTTQEEKDGVDDNGNTRHSPGWHTSQRHLKHKYQTGSLFTSTFVRLFDIYLVQEAELCKSLHHVFDGLPLCCLPLLIAVELFWWTTSCLWFLQVTCPHPIYFQSIFGYYTFLILVSLQVRLTYWLQ